VFGIKFQVSSINRVLRNLSTENVNNVKHRHFNYHTGDCHAIPAAATLTAAAAAAAAASTKSGLTQEPQVRLQDPLVTPHQHPPPRLHPHPASPPSSPHFPLSTWTGTWYQPAPPSTVIPPKFGDYHSGYSSAGVDYCPVICADPRTHHHHHQLQWQEKWTTTDCAKLVGSKGDICLTRQNYRGYPTDSPLATKDEATVQQRFRAAFSAEQIKELEREFKRSPYPD
uniref:Paired domain-containing protein n=1 Tax=Mesocestoides corti TaxID=53468 RepID=A0A5K3FI12_MESCO